MTPQQEKLLKTVINKLNLLLEKYSASDRATMNRETWVTAKYVTKLTVWSSMQMLRARRHGLITFKKVDAGGYRYLLESLNDRIIKPQNSTNVP